MASLIDTSILGRLANSADPLHETANHAILELHRRREVLFISPQNLIEFRNMATRPAINNGLGLSTPTHFARLSGFGPGRIVIDPSSL